MICHSIFATQRYHLIFSILQAVLDIRYSIVNPYSVFSTQHYHMIDSRLFAFNIRYYYFDKHHSIFDLQRYHSLFGILHSIFDIRYSIFVIEYSVFDMIHARGPQIKCSCLEKVVGASKTSENMLPA